MKVLVAVPILRECQRGMTAFPNQEGAVTLKAVYLGER